ncbi:MAG: hypothetical protein F6K42_16765 [Leptolyngbya sp. SIO1D8]|nr:hypothetical protein [Leptolyngbya sp. SIO1D8]
MQALLAQAHSCTTAKVQLARLPERYDASLSELFGQLSQLGIQPEEIEGTLYIDEAQLQRLDLFYPDCKVAKRVFLYQCSDCGDLWLMATPHMYRPQPCVCQGSMQKDASPMGTHQFIASGPEEEMIGFAHSLLAGLCDSMKGP